MWLIKDSLYADRQWEEEVGIGTGIITFLFVGLYWIAPFLLISSGVQPSAPLMSNCDRDQHLWSVASLR